MNQSTNQATRIADEGLALISELQRECAKPMSSRELAIPNECIEEMIIALQDRVNRLMANKLPPNQLRYAYLCRTITESWPLGSSLGNRICTWEHRYNSAGYEANDRK